MPTIEKRFLSPSQAGRELGLSAQRVRQLMNSGELGGVRTPLGRLTSDVDVDAFRKRRAEKAAQGGR